MSNSDSLFHRGAGFRTEFANADEFVDDAKTKLLADPLDWKRTLASITPGATSFAHTHGIPDFDAQFITLGDALAKANTEDREELESIITHAFS